MQFSLVAQQLIERLLHRQPQAGTHLGTTQVEVHQQRSLGGVMGDTHGQVDRQYRLAGLRRRRGDGQGAPAIFIHGFQDLRTQQVERATHVRVLVVGDNAVALQMVVPQRNHPGLHITECIEPRTGRCHGL
ncbi:hypothetical protein D3C73_1076470 [compost metagenome]